MSIVIKRFYALLLIGLLAGLGLGCGGDDGDDPEPPGFMAGELGAVAVAEGEAVQIRSLLGHTNLREYADAGRVAIELAVRDFGDIHGHAVDLGVQVNARCSPEGGRAGAQQIIGDVQVVGVIGTSCSGAGTAASPLISEAGLVMISPSNTSPSLTSDLAGNANPHYHPGYFRISNNDSYTGRAVADFAYHELGLRRMGTVDIDDAYVAGLAQAFSDAFEALGGEVAETARIEFDQGDMKDTLETLTAANPEGIFFPLYESEGIGFVEQARAFAGLKEVTLITADAVLSREFLRTPESEDVYIAGPVLNFPDNVNAVTGMDEAAVKAAAATTYGNPLSVSFWQHAYDATTLLLAAIESVAVVEGGTLRIDRAALREELGQTNGFQGLTGAISCDDFGDCGTGRTNIHHHMDPDMTDPAGLPVVYQVTP